MESIHVDVLTPGIHFLTKKVYKYTWNEEWIKTVKAGYCSECKKPFIHRVITWTCPHCGLYLKGAAGALSYTLKRFPRKMILRLNVRISVLNVEQAHLVILA